DSGSVCPRIPIVRRRRKDDGANEGGKHEVKTAGAFSPRSCIKLLVLVGCTAVLATGCWSYRDVEDRAVVLALGMDALSDGFELVAQVALPGGASSGALQGVDGGKAGKPVWVVSAEGDSLEEASRNLQT